MRGFFLVLRRIDGFSAFYDRDRLFEKLSAHDREPLEKLPRRFLVTDLGRLLHEYVARVDFEHGAHNGHARLLFPVRDRPLNGRRTAVPRSQ